MQTIKITLTCPHCQSSNIVKNGKKSYGDKQNYLCKSCSKQFIGDYQLTYQGCHSQIKKRIKKMLCRGMGIRDIADIEEISFEKILSTLASSCTILRCKASHYDALEIDEFWSYVGSKAKKVWLIYAYHRSSGEIVAWTFGGRDLKTAKKLHKTLKKKGITWDTLVFDDWRSFKTAFKNENCKIGKQYTQGIEGNNCRLRHRIRRAFRKTCNFSKKLENHIKHFELVFHYINFGFV